MPHVTTDFPISLQGSRFIVLLPPEVGNKPVATEQLRSPLPRKLQVPNTNSAGNPEVLVMEMSSELERAWGTAAKGGKDFVALTYEGKQ